MGLGPRLFSEPLIGLFVKSWLGRAFVGSGAGRKTTLLEVSERGLDTQYLFLAPLYLFFCPTEHALPKVLAIL
jgi:hypothetical protein